jgi:hypothetical protein
VPHSSIFKKYCNFLFYVTKKFMTAKRKNRGRRWERGWTNAMLIPLFSWQNKYDEKYRGSAAFALLWKFRRAH